MSVIQHLCDGKHDTNGYPMFTGAGLQFGSGLRRHCRGDDLVQNIAIFHPQVIGSETLIN